MSECVVRMEMPTSCEKCPACDYEEGNCLLADDRNTLPHNGRRRSWCPIICQLPEGHGRLIDVDDFIKHLFTEWTNGEISNSEWCDIRQWMNEETTIVPAEAQRKVYASDAVTPTDTPTDIPTVPAERSET